MIFGRLSEAQVHRISKILDAENISFEVLVDKGVQEANEASMRYDLRHLTAPNISTNILSIQIETNEFEKISDYSKSKLTHLGFYSQTESAPLSELEPKPQELDMLAVHGNKRLVGSNYLLEIICIFVIIASSFILKSLF